MKDNGLSALCFNDTCFLLHNGVEPCLWDDATRMAFATNAHRRCPSSHCLLEEAGVIRCRPNQRGMQGIIAVSLQDKWVPCMTIDLTDRLDDALGKERQFSNGEEYYQTEWSIVKGIFRIIRYLLFLYCINDTTLKHAF
jgi:hypothetical protein